jgi:hypothetical protein
MPETWPPGVPSRILRAGASEAAGETAARSATDSGLARQRKTFTAAPEVISGTIRMTYAQWVEFRDWRKAIGGATFNWPGHPSGTVEARFVAGAQGPATPDAQTPKWLAPVSIEILEF